ACVTPHHDSPSVPLALCPTPETKAVNQRQEADRLARMTGLDGGLADRLRDLDQMGIDLQLVMPPPPQLYFTVPVEIAVKAMQILNDGIAEFLARTPDRSLPAAGVPAQAGNR